MAPTTETASRRFKGVYRHLRHWRVRIWNGDGECYLGHFDNAIEAARAYDRACICLRGWETATREGLNLDEENYDSEVEYLEYVDFNYLVRSIRNDGVAIQSLRQ